MWAVSGNRLTRVNWGAVRRAARRCLVVALIGVATIRAHAFDPPKDVEGVGPTLHLRLDNDFLAGLGQDGGYTHGFQVIVAWPSPSPGEAGGVVLPHGLRSVLTVATPVSFAKRQVLAGIGQALFTPTRRDAMELLRNDRPYAAVLLAGVGENARRGQDLAATQLRFGMVGPSALGEQVQNGTHHLFGATRVHGWRHQLRDEPVFQWLHERLRRERRQGPGAWSGDAIGHAGISLGNLFTFANVGGELRAGRGLPDDFGSDPFRPAGEHAGLPSSAVVHPSWGGHVFVSFDVRAVARNITLDGNTWQDSHRVHRRPFVADFGHGVAVTFGPWKLAFARYYRTREFDGQAVRPVIGSLIVSRRF